MARISGVDLPRDKRIEYALPYIYGIGLTLSREILAKTGINPDTRVRDLTEEEVAKIRETLDCFDTGNGFLNVTNFHRIFTLTGCHLKTQIEEFLFQICQLGV